MNEVKKKTSNIINLATNIVFTVFENKIPENSKYITTLKFSKLTAEKFYCKIKQVNLASKANIADFVNKTHFNNKLKNVN